MILTTDNLVEWKRELESECIKCMPIRWRGLSRTLEDHQWIRDYIGEDTVDVVMAELEELEKMK